MDYLIYYKIGDKVDFFHVEGESEEEIREKTDKELEARNGKYKYSIWLND